MKSIIIKYSLTALMVVLFNCILFSSSPHASLTVVLSGEKEIKFILDYSSIQDLKQQAKEKLLSLDKEIAEKNFAASIPGNPFRGIALKRLKELTKQREAFLNLKWDCPYLVRCNHCDGGDKNWFVGDGIFRSGPCKKCGGRNKFRVHESHSIIDSREKCGITIGALLGESSNP
jgi:hypothetical protein